MMTDLKSVLTRNPGQLALDFAGAFALAATLIGALFLPGMI